MEGWSEIEDEVIEDDAKLSSRSNQSTKSNKSKSPANNKENSLKRQKGNHLFKRQKSKEPLSPTKSKSTNKAKTPDHDLKNNKKSASLKKENAAKRKISMKQDPARYDNFLKSSSSYQRRRADAKETSGSNKSTLSGSSIGPSEKRLRSNTRVTRSSSKSRLANSSSTTSVRRTPSVNCSPAGGRTAIATKSSTARRLNNTKRNTSVNRSTTNSKVRRKSSVRKIMNESTTTNSATGKRMITRSSSSNLARKPVEKSPQVTKKAKNLKRSIGRTSLEGKAPSVEENNLSPNQSTSSGSKRPRISSLPLPTISVMSPEKLSSSDSVPMSPSPFVFETTSLSDKVGNRLCPLGKRSRLPQSSGMVGRFLRDHRATSISVCSPVQEEISNEPEDIFQELKPPPLMLNLTTDSSAPRALTAAARKLRRQSNFKLVRLNSVKNKRKSMLRNVATSKISK